MISRVRSRPLLAIASILFFAFVAGAANAETKNQTQGQQDAHRLACVNGYYACVGKCSQAVSIPLMNACVGGCEGRYNSCAAQASVTGGLTPLRMKQ